MFRNMKRTIAFLTVLMMLVGCLPVSLADDATVNWYPDHKTFTYGEASYESKITETEPTCTEDGKKTYEAIVDGVVKDTFEEKTADKLGHDLDKGTIDPEPTCSEPGVKTFKCQRKDCKYSETEEVKATGIHTPGDLTEDQTKHVDPTCTKEGSEDWITTCTQCGAELSRETKTIEKLEHVWVKDPDSKENKAATCEEDGVEAYKCSNKGCKETKTEPIKKLGHEETTAKQENVVEATCAAAGSYDSVVYCGREGCGKELSRETVTVAKLEHEWDKGKETKAATCTEDGETTFTCGKCKETKVEAIKAKGHTAGKAETIVEKEATCKEAGKGFEVVKCTVCGEELSQKEVVIPATGEHDWELKETITEPTCTKEGRGLYVCSVCDAEKEDIIKALGHTPGEVVREDKKAPTCTEEGSYDEVQYCTVCEEEIPDSRKSVTVDALGHDLQKDEKKSTAATCTADGTDYMQCSRCEYHEEVTVKSEGHKYEKDEKVSRDATCTKEGEYVEVCSVCGDVHKETVKKLDHTKGTPVQENVVAAKCGVAGSYDEVIYCTVCEEEISRTPKTIDALEHNWVKDEKSTLNKAATCTEAGVQAYKCSNTGCKETKTEVVEALGHDWVNTKVTKEPTCEEDGLEYGICSRCEAIDEKIVIPKLGHSYDVDLDGEIDEGVFADSAKFYWSDDSEGAGSVELTYICKNDSKHKKSVIIEFTADQCDFEETKAPTCKGKGETGIGVYTFTLADKLADGSTASDSHEVVIPALTKHTPDDVVKENEKEPTCTDVGSYEAVVYCAECGDELSRKTVETKALGHDFSDEEDDFVKENEKNIPGTDGYDDTKPYTYDLVTYCKNGCGEKKKIDTISVDAKGHNPADPVKENEVEPTCTEDGSYDLVIYCKDDNEEILRTTVTVDALGHDWVKTVENYVEPTCTENGSFDRVFTCSVCGEIDEENSKHIDDETYDGWYWDEPSIWAQGHEYTYTVVGEITKQPTYEAAGTKADVTYCATCREKITETNVAEVPKLVKVDTTGYSEEDAKAIEEAMKAVDKAAAEGTYAELLEAKDAVKDAVVTAEKNVAAQKVADAEAAQKAAEEKATAAEAAKKEAEEKAAAAEAAKKEAEEKAAAAEAKAATAEEAQKAAEAAQKTAEAAQKAAEDAKKAAEDAKKAAEEQAGADVKTAEEAQKAAEAAQKTAEEAQKAAEDAQKAAEDAQKAAAEKAAEELKAAQEAKKAAEDKVAATLQAAEAAQKAAEAAQKAAEEAKKAAEQKIAEAEAAIKKAEEAAAAAATKAPAKVTTTGVKAAKKALTLKWTAASDCDGYEIQVATNKSFSKNLKIVTVSNAATASKKISKLLEKKTYFVRIRAYKNVEGGKIYGEWSDKLKKKTK